MTKVIYVYTGNGDFYYGIPRRDLTEDDVERLNEVELAMVQSGKIYTPATPKKPKKSADAPKDGE